jgi:4-hydroxybenzoate polyprenyltransferase
VSTLGDLARLARPKGTLLFLTVPLTGYGFAHWDGRLALTRPIAMAFVLAAWALLSAGSLWLNAALDGDDESGALFSMNARRPKHLVAYAWLALALAVALASYAGVLVGVACALCAVMAVLYSHPRTKWKAHPVMGPLVNGAGYGLASFFAGYAVVARERGALSDAATAMTCGSALAMSLLALFVVGMTFAAQAYQEGDDARRGYRTLVVTAGPAACLRVATWTMRAALAGVAVGAALGVYPRLVLVGLPVFALAELTMARWRRAPGGGSADLAAQFATRMVAGGAVLVALATFAALR